jgi:hypothetical protein
MRLTNLSWCSNEVVACQCAIKQTINANKGGLLKEARLIVSVEVEVNASIVIVAVTTICRPLRVRHQRIFSLS